MHEENAPLRRFSAGLLALVLIFVARGLWYADFVPFWDGRAYADCTVDAALGGMHFSQLNCFAHPSAAYIGLLALPQLLSPGSYPLMLGVNLLLGALAIVCFHRVLRWLFPSGDAALPCLLATAAFSTHPVLIAAAINPNVDYGVLVFLLPVVYFTLRRRFVEATAFGIALVFAKESGFVFLGALALSYAATQALVAHDWKARWQAVRPMLWVLLLPTFLLAAYFLFKPKSVAASSSLWQGMSLGDLLGLLLPMQTDSSIFYHYLVGIFVLSFLWIPTVAMLAGGVAWLVKRRRAPDRWGTERQRSMAMIALTFAVSTYVLTRFPTYFNVRYFLPLVPLLLILAHGALVALASRTMQCLTWATVAFLFLISNYLSVDPVSAAALGRFHFGAYAMFQMTTPDRACCGYGRDQLMYNLQFAEFHYLQNKLYEDLRPDATTTLAGSHWANVYLTGPIDAHTFHRTLRRRADNIDTKWLDHFRLLRGVDLPETLVYLSLPNYPNWLLPFDRYYEPVGMRTYSHYGYWMDVYQLKLKAGARNPGPLPRANTSESP